MGTWGLGYWKPNPQSPFPELIPNPLSPIPAMKHTITLIPGDGIGPEVTEAVVRILKATGVSIAWEEHHAGLIAFERYGQALPVALIDSIRRNKVALKGPVT